MMEQDRELARAYFHSGRQYLSRSQGELLEVADMPPMHAANAAGKLLREASEWAQCTGYRGAWPPELWMTTTPLFVALRERAG